MMKKFLYPTHPVRCIITGPSECGKSLILTKLISNIISEYDKTYVYSSSLHQDLYQKLNKRFSNFIPIHIVLNIRNEEDFDLVIEELSNIKDFEISDIETETCDSIEELKFLQEYVSEETIVIILDDLYQKELEYLCVKAMFKRSRHKNISIFIISRDYYEISKKNNTLQR